LFSNQDYKIFTVNCGGEVIGTLVCFLCINLSGRGRDYMIIDNVIVRKDFHRKGIGKDLIDIAIKYARAKNCFKIIIVSNNRFKSGGFYKKCGFENKTSKVYIRHI
jgi:predicted N-acetyltransferase YhbS